MHTPIRHALAIAALALATQASAQVTIYENDGFSGRSFTTQRAVGNLDRYGYNDRASSVLVVARVAGKSARTPASAAAASCCARAATPRCAPWA